MVPPSRACRDTRASSAGQLSRRRRRSGWRDACWAASCSMRRYSRSASLRWSGVMRSNINTPWRWSISCWNMRASSSSASISTTLPSRSTPRTWTSFRSQHLDVQTRDREAALVVDPFTVGLDDLRIDDGERLVAEIPHDDLLLHTDLRCGERETRCRSSTSVSNMSSTSRMIFPSTSSTRLACDFRTGSPKVRMLYDTLTGYGA